MNDVPWDEADEQFWSPIVRSGGAWDFDAVKRELHNYRILLVGVCPKCELGHPWACVECGQTL